MPFVHAPYEELLALKPANNVFSFKDVPPFASFYRLSNKAEYWYARWSENGERKTKFLGKETPEFLEHINAARDEAEKYRKRRKLVASFLKSGFPTPPEGVVNILKALEEKNYFKCGGVLIGQASVLHAQLRQPCFPYDGLPEKNEIVLYDKRQELKGFVSNHMFPVQGLRPAVHDLCGVNWNYFEDAETGTEVKVYAPNRMVGLLKNSLEELLEFENMAKPRPPKRAEANPFFTVVETARRRDFAFLGFLLKETVDAVIPVDGGIFVRTPDPCRYAIYRLLTACMRNTSKERGRDLAEANKLLITLFDLYEEKMVSVIHEAVRHWSLPLHAVIRSFVLTTDVTEKFRAILPQN